MTFSTMLPSGSVDQLVTSPLILPGPVEPPNTSMQVKCPVAEWSWVELNYRPHAYQAGSYEHEFRLEVLTTPRLTNILLSKSRI
jgi:hypothetical protein